MEYTVIYATNKGQQFPPAIMADLIQHVNEMIQKGWRPLRGISFAPAGQPTFCQAMVKE